MMSTMRRSRWCRIWNGDVGDAMKAAENIILSLDLWFSCFCSIHFFLLKLKLLVFRIFNCIWSSPSSFNCTFIKIYCFLMLSNMSLSLPSEATEKEIEATRMPPPTLRTLTQGTKTSTFALSNKR
jgi:hypothetical protein